ncbi:hypothetical protein GCK32_012412, partial [Trichostrongylus colubriformis]
KAYYQHGTGRKETPDNSFGHQTTGSISSTSLFVDAGGLVDSDVLEGQGNEILLDLKDPGKEDDLPLSVPITTKRTLSYKTPVTTTTEKPPSTTTYEPSTVTLRHSEAPTMMTLLPDIVAETTQRDEESRRVSSSTQEILDSTYSGTSTVISEGTTATSTADDVVEVSSELPASVSFSPSQSTGYVSYSANTRHTESATMPTTFDVVYTSEEPFTTVRDFTVMPTTSEEMPTTEEERTRMSDTFEEASMTQQESTASPSTPEEVATTQKEFAAVLTTLEGVITTEEEFTMMSAAPEQPSTTEIASTMNTDPQGPSSSEQNYWETVNDTAIVAAPTTTRRRLATQRTTTTSSTTTTSETSSTTTTRMMTTTTPRTTTTSITTPTQATLTTYETTTTPVRMTETSLPTTTTVPEIDKLTDLTKRKHGSATRKRWPSEHFSEIEEDIPQPIPISRTFESAPYSPKEPLSPETDGKKSVMLKVSGAASFASYSRVPGRKPLDDDVDRSAMRAVEFQSVLLPDSSWPVRISVVLIAMVMVLLVIPIPVLVTAGSMCYLRSYHPMDRTAFSERVGQCCVVLATILLFFIPCLCICLDAVLIYIHVYNSMCPAVQLLSQYRPASLENLSWLHSGSLRNTRQRCQHNLDAIEGMWLGCVAFAFFSIPTVFALFKLSKYYLRMKTEYYWNACEGYGVIRPRVATTNDTLYGNIYTTLQQNRPAAKSSSRSGAAADLATYGVFIEQPIYSTFRRA